jgi:hypothetical protein
MVESVEEERATLAFSYLSFQCDRILDIKNLKGGIILAHHFRGYN